MITKSKKADHTDGKTKPFMSKPLDQKSARRIDDYAKEVFKEVQTQRSPNYENSRQGQWNERPNPKSSETILTRVEQETSRRSTGRLSVHQKTNKVHNQKVAAPSLLPKTGHEMIQAIVYSEILAPPKSKR